MSPIVKKLVVEPYSEWDDFVRFTGRPFPASHFSHVIDSDTDVYEPTGKLLCRFRKNVFTSEEIQSARDAFEDAAAKAKSYRKNAVGANAGRDHPRNKRAHSLLAGYWDRRDIAGTLMLQRAGWPTDVRMPEAVCRTTRFTLDQPAAWQRGMPWLQAVARAHAALAPTEYRRQLARAKKALQQFIVPKTAYSTITVNHNWRTNTHVDAGDYADGLGNLAIAGTKDWEGGWLGFPRFRVAIDARPGDFIVMNVHEWHCNTAIRKHTPSAVRLTFVCYLRDRIPECNRIFGEGAVPAQSLRS